MVLEFNCRFGDPETQPIMMRMESDLLEAIEASIDGRVSDGDFRWSPDPAVCVVMASGGYPGAFEAGKLITGIDDADRMQGVKVFHAGTNRRDDTYYTSGGRVLGVTARGNRPARSGRARLRCGDEDSLRRHALSQGHRRARAEASGRSSERSLTRLLALKAACVARFAS